MGKPEAGRLFLKIMVCVAHVWCVKSVSKFVVAETNFEIMARKVL